MKIEEYIELLGITEDDIKNVWTEKELITALRKARRRQLNKYHPDQYQAESEEAKKAEEMFKEIDNKYGELKKLIQLKGQDILKAFKEYFKLKENQATGDSQKASTYKRTTGNYGDPLKNQLNYKINILKYMADYVRMSRIINIYENDNLYKSLCITEQETRHKYNGKPIYLYSIHIHPINDEIYTYRATLYGATSILHKIVFYNNEGKTSERQILAEKLIWLLVEQICTKDNVEDLFKNHHGCIGRIMINKSNSEINLKVVPAPDIEDFLKKNGLNPNFEIYLRWKKSRHRI